MAFGDKAVELCREIERLSDDDLLPAFSEDKFRLVLTEMNALVEQNLTDAPRCRETRDKTLYRTLQWRHSLAERNKRCIIAYEFNRLTRLKQMRWQLGSVLPSELRNNLSQAENNWFRDYNSNLASYMGAIGNLDLTQYIKPPKSLYIEVRVSKTYGEFETADGIVLQLKVNSQHFMLRSDAEQLIQQGFLIQVT